MIGKKGNTLFLTGDGACLLCEKRSTWFLKKDMVSAVIVGLAMVRGKRFALTGAMEGDPSGKEGFSGRKSAGSLLRGTILSSRGGIG